MCPEWTDSFILVYEQKLTEREDFGVNEILKVLQQESFIKKTPINAYKMVPATKQEVPTSCSYLRAAGSDQKPQSCSSGRPGYLLPAAV